jgi:large subunit ribosomal protein L29
MKPNEARNLNPEENKEAVEELREELLDLRFQAAVGQATNPRRIRAATARDRAAADRGP